MKIVKTIGALMLVSVLCVSCEKIGIKTFKEGDRVTIAGEAECDAVISNLFANTGDNCDMVVKTARGEEKIVNSKELTKCE